MISLFEIAERTQTGEKVEEKKWDMEFFQAISRLVKKYDIKMPETHCYINRDDELVERAYEAAVEFLETMGIYCITTRRRVALSREEILTAKREAPTDELFRQAAEDGMTTLIQDGIHKIFQGLTDLDEIRRVCVT